MSLDLQDGAELVIPDEHIERALFPVSGQLLLDGQALANAHLVVLDTDSLPTLRSVGQSRVMLLGGAPLDGPRHVCRARRSSFRCLSIDAKDVAL